MKKRILAFALIGLLPACVEKQADTPQDGEGMVARWEAELFRADEVFSETIGREGLSRWGSFFTEGGSVIQAGVGEIRGVEAIQASIDAAAGAITSFSWAPDRATVSKGGDLGYTVGRYRTTAVGPDGVEMVSTGTYVSVWRRQDDGGWKVEMDLGNPLGDPEPLPPEASADVGGGL